MERFGEPAQLQQIAAPRGLREDVTRRNLPPVFVMRAQRGVVADRATMRDRKDRLEHAEHGIAAIDDGAAATRVVRDGTWRLKAGRIQIDHAHGEFDEVKTGTGIRLNPALAGAFDAMTLDVSYELYSIQEQVPCAMSKRTQAARTA
jgi:hypothetical protein